MKKLFIILLILMIVIMSSSCDMQEAPDPEAVQNSTSRFIMINHSTVDNKPDVFVYVDTETGVAYIGSVSGSFLPMYDANGNILVYEEYIRND